MVEVARKNWSMRFFIGVVCLVRHVETGQVHGVPRAKRVSCRSSTRRPRGLGLTMLWLLYRGRVLLVPIPTEATEASTRAALLLREQAWQR